MKTQTSHLESATPLLQRRPKPISPENKNSLFHTLNSPLMALISASTNTKPYPFFPLSRKTPMRGGTMVLANAILTSSIVQNHSHFSPFAVYKTYGTCKLKNIARISASMAVSVPESNRDQDANYGRILLSDVVVKQRPRIFLGRKWDVQDISTAAVVVGMHLLSLLAPFNFNWPAFWTAVALYIVTGLFGITLSFHRNLSHRSFKVPNWLEYLFAYCGAQALQGNPIDWVSTHRYHHQFCDSERDPHSPYEGFWFSHMNWMFDTNAIAERCGEPSNVGDLKKQHFYRFIEKTYIFHPIALGALLYALGGFPFIVWGMGVRIVWVYHITWLVNSACHVWGKQAWNTGDLSRNNWWVSLLAFGEGWHNNHHAFEFSARHGLEWWQLDMTWYVIRFLQAIGLATDVKLPSEIQKQRMAFKNVSISN